MTNTFQALRKYFLAAAIPLTIGAATYVAYKTISAMYIQINTRTFSVNERTMSFFYTTPFNYSLFCTERDGSASAHFRESSILGGTLERVVIDINGDDIAEIVSRRESGIFKSEKETYVRVLHYAEHQKFFDEADHELVHLRRRSEEQINKQPR